MDGEDKPNTFLLVAVYPYRDFYKFKGRAARSTFWLHVVMAYIFSYAISAACLLFLFDASAFETAVVYADTDPALMRSALNDFFAAMVPTMAASTLAFIALPSMLVKRMHDSGRTGWWAAPYLAVSALGIGVAILLLPKFFGAVSQQDTQALADMVAPFFVFGAASAVSFIVAVVLAVFKGQEGSNRFGEQPFAAIN
ncbi:MAG: DUF805 domain-containing protein [Pseudomonadota bacterium]